MKESSSPETKTGNKAIILIPEKGLCYHPDWPVEPTKDKLDPTKYAKTFIDYISKAYEHDLAKAISEAVPFTDQDRHSINIFFEKENHPYPIPEGYEVEERESKEHTDCYYSLSPGNYSRQDCDDTCGPGCPVYGSIDKKLKKLAYLLPLKESSTEAIDFKKLAFDMAVKVGESHDVVFVTRLTEALQSGSKKTVSRVEAGENKPDFEKQVKQILENHKDVLYVASVDSSYNMALGIELLELAEIESLNELWNAHVLPLSSELNTLREENKRLKEQKDNIWNNRDELAAKRYETIKENEKLTKFKYYVHERLDAMGIPADPEPENNKAHGCRIEGRLNILDALKTELDEVRKGLKAALPILHKYQNDDPYEDNTIEYIESLLNPEKKITPNGAHPE